ncbi:hypothetical protein [Cellulomonas fengjieae]|uniref:Uncharacterized protein n=1 Tax=Cellulomonas fengjieae TaxID=2819978 RepID=A0ABS3SEU9_9CELL|nr:hypothetical protein [Cellulomonas fengjieae]MBO3084014.1 hypothetical protein [Cellulomonas fengjieae]QVI64721.1 hypothetical protein KG102_11105 [Cellulomonas fengjieae]
MADRRTGARMQLVEVDDAPSVTTGAQPTPPHGAAPDARAGRPRGTLRRWWPVAALAVLVLTGATVVVSARNGAFVARVAAVPGLVRPLDAAPEPLWQTRASIAPGTVLAADGGLVVLVEGAEAWTVTSHDPVSGAPRWTADVAPVSRSGFESTDVICPASRADLGSLLVCLVREPQVLYSGDVSNQEPPRLAVVPLSARDGARLGGWEVRGDVVGIDRVGDDIVVGTLDDDRHLLVQRRDARTGDVVWSMVTPEVMEAPEQIVTASLHVRPPVVVLHGGQTLVLDVRDGRTLVTGARFGALQVSALGERFATWAPSGGGHVHAIDGSELYPVEGLPAELTADDGSLPDGVIIDEGSQLTAVHEATGAPLWRTQSSLDPRLLVSRRLVASGASTYGVIDATDGTELWEIDTGTALPWYPTSDGTLVLGPGSSPGGGPELWGRGLQDGVRYWSVALPEGVRRVDAVGGVLVVRTEKELVVYG